MTLVALLLETVTRRGKLGAIFVNVTSANKARLITFVIEDYNLADNIHNTAKSSNSVGKFWTKGAERPR